MTDARAWVGEGAKGDSLDGDRIAAALPQEAVALHAILRDEKVVGLLRIRRDASRAAAVAQKTFRRYSALAILGTTLATFASGLLLYDAGSPSAAAVAEGPASGPGPTGAQAPAPIPAVSSLPNASGVDALAITPAEVPWLVTWTRQFRTPIVMVQVLGLFLAALATALLAGQDYAQRWANNRRKAELLRREVFLEIARLAAEMVPRPLEAPDPANPLVQALELFRRYQHDLQARFYADSTTRHGRTATVLTFLTAVLAGIAAIAGTIASLGPVALIVSAFLGIAVPILFSAAQSWRVTGADSDRAAAYLQAREQLDNISLTLGDVRRKAALGDAAAVRAYMDNVHLVMTTENDAWSPPRAPARGT